MRGFATLIICAVLANPVLAQDDTPVRTERAAAAFAAWLETQDTTGVLSLVRDGQVVLTQGFGRDAEAPVELASLSKTITGVCATVLVSQGVMEWEDRFSDTVGGSLDFSLRDLVTHQTGLTVDGTQVAMLLWLNSQGTHKSDAVRRAIETRQAADKETEKPAQGYHYNNENFALAGLMIEAATGRDYADVCHEVTMDPAGVTVSPSPHSGAFLPWGGWQMTAREHAIWHAYWFAGEGFIAATPKALPYAEIDEGLYYGPGVTFRTLGLGNSFWHFGALCFPGRLNAGAYVSSVFGEWTAVTAYDACVEWDAMFALDNTIWTALRGPVE